MKILYEYAFKSNKKNIIISVILLILCGIMNMFSINQQQMAYADFVDIPKVTCFEYFLNIQGSAVGFLHIIYFLALTLAIGNIFFREKKSSLLQFSIVRGNVNSYIKNRIRNIGAISVIFMFVCQVSMLIFSLILYPIDSPSTSQEYIMYINKEFFSNYPLIYCFIVIFNSCLMAFAYACFTIFISIIFDNIYIVLTLPYLFSIGLSIILTSFPMYSKTYGYIMYNLSPTMLAGGYISDSINALYPILYWGILSLVFYKLSVITFELKFKNEKLI